MAEGKLGIDMSAFPTLTLPAQMDWQPGSIDKIKELRARTGCGLWEAVTLFKIIRHIKLGRIEITPAVMQAVTNPKLKQALVEAICLIKIGS